MLTKEEFVKGILDGNTTILARAITLVESRHQEHQALASDILNEVLPFTGNAQRIGISGIPGVGKSTFIESYGEFLIREKNRSIAILAIDPSSERTGGSILGDKTRMSKLSQNPKAFIRPSPSSGHLGGVAKKTRESLLLCEACGFDTIFIETVGVGQSETIVSQMVDFFILLLQPGAGDDLQGIKRGIMEVADLVCVNKCDGQNEHLSQIARHEYERALHILKKSEDFIPGVLEISALYEKGLDKVYEVMEHFFRDFHSLVKKRRSEGEVKWLKELFYQKIEGLILQDPKLSKLWSETNKQVAESQVSASYGSELLFSQVIEGLKGKK